jgi:hypothetical protein
LGLLKISFRGVVSYNIKAKKNIPGFMFLKKFLGHDRDLVVALRTRRITSALIILPDLGVLIMPLSKDFIKSISSFRVNDYCVVFKENKNFG